MGGVWSVSAIFFLLQGTTLGLVSHLLTLAKSIFTKPYACISSAMGCHLLKPRLRIHALHFSYTAVFSFIWLWGQMWTNRIIVIILVPCHFMLRWFQFWKVYSTLYHSVIYYKPLRMQFFKNVCFLNYVYTFNFVTLSQYYLKCDVYITEYVSTL